jgi:hypothetical protein
VDDVLLLLLPNEEAASADDGNADQTEQITMAAAVLPAVPPRGGALCRLNLLHLPVSTISGAIHASLQLFLSNAHKTRMDE